MLPIEYVYLPSIAPAYDLAGGQGGKGGWGVWGELERGGGGESIYITSPLISCHQLLFSEEPESNN